jgi:hypothetical protein
MLWAYLSIIAVIIKVFICVRLCGKLPGGEFPWTQYADSVLGSRERLRGADRPLSLAAC